MLDHFGNVAAREKAAQRAHDHDLVSYRYPEEVRCRQAFHGALPSFVLGTCDGIRAGTL
jgi:hypothetical protein